MSASSNNENPEPKNIRSTLAHSAISIAAVHAVQTTSFFEIAETIGQIQGIYAILMNLAAEEISTSHSGHTSSGFIHLKYQTEEELDDVRERISALAKLQAEAQRADNQAARDAAAKHIWPELYAEVVTKWGEILREADNSMDPNNVIDWPEAMQEKFFTGGTRYYNEVLAKLGGSNNPFVAGSLLPWIELRMRREFAEEEASTLAEAGRSTLLDDQLILERDAEGHEASPVAVAKGEVAKRLHDDGHTVAQISQILNIKRSAVERILGRLHATEPDQQTA